MMNQVVIIIVIIIVIKAKLFVYLDVTVS